MWYAIFLRVEGAAGSLVYDFWKAQEIPHEVHPHVTLAIFEDCTEDHRSKILDLVDHFRKDARPFSVCFSHMGLFPNEDNHVVFLAPTVSSSLLELHKRFHKAADQAGMKDHSNVLYRPGMWVPHCTLVDKLSPESASQIMAKATQFFGDKMPLTTRFDRIEVLEIDGEDIRPLLCEPL